MSNTASIDPQTKRPLIRTLLYFMCCSLLCSLVESPFSDTKLVEFSGEWPAFEFSSWLVDNQQTQSIDTLHFEVPSQSEIRAPVEQNALSSEGLNTTRDGATTAAQAACDVPKDRKTVIEFLDGLIAQWTAQPTPLLRPCRSPSGTTQGECNRRELDRFFLRLEQRLLKRKPGIVRWSQFGDSLVAWDYWTGELRRLLQSQFGDAGRGFLPMTLPKDGYGYGKYYVGSNQWESLQVTSGSWPPYGLGGFTFRAMPGKAASIAVIKKKEAKPFDRIGILYEASPYPSKIRLRAGTQRSQHRLSAGKEPALEWITLDTPQSRVNMSGFLGGRYFHGVFVERGQNGVVVDNLGMISQRSDHLLRIKEERWQKMLQARDMDVGSFWFGAVSGKPQYWHFNPPPKEWLQMQQDKYATLIKRFRTAKPEADCVIISHLVRGRKTHRMKTVQVLATVEPIVAMQRALALKTGCAFWDSYDAMGKAAGADAWWRHKPRLLSDDLRHPTREGYEELGRRFYRSMLWEMHSFLKTEADKQRSTCLSAQPKPLKPSAP